MENVKEKTKLWRLISDFVELKSTNAIEVSIYSVLSLYYRFFWHVYFGFIFFWWSNIWPGFGQFVNSQRLMKNSRYFFK